MIAKTKIYFFYKDNTIKESIEKIRFSYTRPYQLIFHTELKTLFNSVENHESGLLFLIHEGVKDGTRTFIKRMLFEKPKVKICLCSKGNFALEAWKLNVFNFIDQPLTSNKLIDGFKRYINNTGNDINSFAYKSSEGIVKIPLNTICYFKAAGNYTELHFVSGQLQLLTHQIQYFEKLTGDSSAFQRVNRSFIINLALIEKLSSGVLSFYGNAPALNLSRELGRKIKKTILST